MEADLVGWNSECFAEPVSLCISDTVDTLTVTFIHLASEREGDRNIALSWKMLGEV